MGGSNPTPPQAPSESGQINILLQYTASRTMPLPDERPRQSVANLIGRFEKQKPPSGSSAPPPSFPRTSSVASHRTGDSALEEVKERREWPPKSAESSVSPPVEASNKRLSSTFLTPSVPKERSPPLDSGRPTPPIEPKLSIPSPAATTPSQAQPTPAQTKSHTPLSQAKHTTTRTPASAKSTPKAPAKSSTAVPPKSHASSGAISTTSTPLKPQQTESPSTSTGTSTRTAAKPRTSAPKTPTPVTPARAKTPLSTARPKTPSSTARPKTPSGLYAPTAASLARSRGGAPAPPPVEKPKRKITTDLSKPTAASASRVRSPAPTPVKGGKAPVAKAPATTVARAAVKSPAPKGTTPVKQPAAARPSSGRVAAGQNKDITAKKTASSVGPAGAAKVAATATATAAAAAAIVATETAVESDENVPEVASEVSPRSIEAETEDTALSDEVLESPPLDEEHLSVEKHAESPVEEIENYDEDFPEEGQHEVHDEHVVVSEHHDVTQEESVEHHEEHENGDITGIEADNGHLDEEAEEEHLAEQEPTTYDDVPITGTHDIQAEISEEPTQSSHESLDVSPDLLHSEDVVEPHNHEDEATLESVAQAKVGSDLEDIVNLLESGPTIQKPSIDAPPSEGAVSETGEIPDEY